MSSSISGFRRALSANFDKLVTCLFPIGLVAHILPWDNEEHYLNNLYWVAQSSKQLAKNLIFPTSKSNYSLRIECEKVHKRIWIDFPFKQKSETCEIGDILLMAKYIDPIGTLSRNVCFLQVKASEKNRRFDVWDIDEIQVGFYSKWSTIYSAYTGRGSNRNVLISNLNITFKNRLFSPYLLLGRNYHYGLSNGSYPWITGTDLIEIASEPNGKIHGPLEVAFLYHLIQMLFQVSGEIDTFNYRTSNQDLTQLVDSILNYVKVNDPPEGEEKPFLVMQLTVKGSEREE